jgi:hypothetical protein
MGEERMIENFGDAGLLNRLKPGMIVAREDDALVGVTWSIYLDSRDFEDGTTIAQHKSLQGALEEAHNLGYIRCARGKCNACPR